MTEQIEIYAKGITTEAQSNITNILLTGIDASQVLSEFTTEERLDSVDPGDIADYLTKLQNEERELTKNIKAAMEVA